MIKPQQSIGLASTRCCRALTAALFAVLGGLATTLPQQAMAQPVEIPSTWGGPLLTRPRLTGDWGGLRDALGRKGVSLDVDVLSLPTKVLSGGRSTGGQYWGNATYTLNVDMQKAGLWAGGFFKVQASSSFGDKINGSGAMVPIYAGLISPQYGASETGLESLTFTQFLSHKFGVFAGKIFTLDSSHGEFTGNYKTQFQNAGIALPLASGMVPISAFGGGAIYLPTEKIMLSALVLDPSGTVMSNDLGKAFNDGVMVVAGGKLSVSPFGLRGHQSLTGVWSNKQRVSLIQDPSNLARLLRTGRFPLLANPGPILEGILADRFPGLLTPAQPLNKESSTWSIVYGFDQYLWHPDGDPKRGVGVFFNLGASDGRANPVAYSLNLGVGAKGVVPGRLEDSFGIGWAHTKFSDNFVPFLRDKLALGLTHEDAVEMYYNAAITPWMNVTLNLQVVRPGITKQHVPGSSPSLQSLDTAVIGGLRLLARF